MSQVPIIDITRFRMNSHSSIDNYSSRQNDGQQNSNDNKQKTIMPLILKKMNSVQKYVNEFKATQMMQKKSRRKRGQSPLYDPSLSTSKHLQKLYSHSPQLSVKQEDLQKLSQKCYVKYNSTSEHNSNAKNQVLDEVQKQYVKLKYNIHTTSINENLQQGKNNGLLPRTQYIRSQHHSQHNNSIGLLQKTSTSQHQSFVNPKSISLLQKRKKRQNQNQLESFRISHNDVRKEMQSSMVEENGKKYFADLYLMKKQRDKMLKEIFGSNQKLPIKSRQNLNAQGDTNNGYLIGGNQAQGHIARNTSYRSNKTGFSLQKSTNFLNPKQSQKRFPKLKINMTQFVSTPYQQKMKAQQHNFVQQKILKDRSQKKQKMLKGRNMNWNVYYEMLALKKNQKDKLKLYCRFSQMYGDD